MILLHLSQMLPSGLLLSTVWLACISFLWMSLQYEAGEVLKAEPLKISGLVLFPGGHRH